MAARILRAPRCQGKIDSLSRRGQGQPKALDISGELSDLQGSFHMENETIRFPDLTFVVEGATIALSGTYNMDGGQIDFRGKLRTQAKLSQTVTGWKSVVLKPFDPFFKGKDGGGRKFPSRSPAPGTIRPSEAIFTTLTTRSELPFGRVDPGRRISGIPRRTMDGRRIKMSGQRQAPVRNREGSSGYRRTQIATTNAPKDLRAYLCTWCDSWHLTKNANREGKRRSR